MFRRALLTSILVVSPVCLLAMAAPTPAHAAEAGVIVRPEVSFPQGPLRACVQLSPGTIHLKVLDVIDGLRGLPEKIRPRRICA